MALIFLFQAVGECHDVVGVGMLRSVPTEWPKGVVAIVSSACESGRIGSIREALKAIKSIPADQQGRTFTLGICSTFTIDAQLDALTLALATIPCQPSVIVGDLDNIEQSLLNNKSKVLQAKPDALLVLWRLEELHPRLVFEHEGMSPNEREQAATDVIERITQLSVASANAVDSPIFLSTLPERFSFSGATSDLYALHGPRRAVQRINQTLQDLSDKYSNIYLFDFSGWSFNQGVSAFDLKMDLYARQPIANSALMSFSLKLTDTLKPILLPASKVLALDLDNVLWGGILGEDGIDGIKIGHDFPGNIYRHIQLHVLALKHRGVLLVLLSKNNLSDVEQAFAAIPDMPLKLDDFIALRVNWEEKGKNLKEIAEILNLGLDSFVFIDDQAFEREQMRFVAPQVRVLEITEDALNILNELASCRLFDLSRVSDTDRRRSDDYVAQMQRRNLELEINSPEKFLQTLQLKVRVDLVTNETIPRAVQMLMKTNQFNLTTKRHNESDLRSMQANSDNVIVALSLSDRFGNQGIVGLAIVLGNRVTKEANIDTLLLSCRAIGRGVEQGLWSVLVSHISRLGYLSLRAEYRRTSKNMQVSDLFEKFGMQRLPDSTHERSYFLLELPCYPKFPNYVYLIEKI